MGIFMKEHNTTSANNDQFTGRIQRFYNQHPYPPPLKDLDSYQQRWQDEDRRRADFHLNWPYKPYSEDLTILVAGCGTSQAAKYAIRQPAACVVGIDLSPISVHHTQELKRKYDLNNLEVHQLPVESAGKLGRRFDKIICTGVLHHLPNPDGGLRAMREVLEPDGAMHLMVYAAYGRAGIYMLQEYARQLGVGDSDEEINDFAKTLMALPGDHPLARLLAESPDFRSKGGLADALLNPQDRAYTVPQLFDFINGAGLQFGRWVRQAPYLPQCGAFAETPHAPRLMKLPQPEQYAAIELLRGMMTRHSLILYRDDAPDRGKSIRFDNDEWLGYLPIRLPDTVCVEEGLPPGAAAVLINQSHTYADIVLPIDASDKGLYDVIDGALSIGEILEKVQAGEARIKEHARTFFERLWWYDQVVFDASESSTL
jgi:2-polyprenyl-3-methyl-5-hydroxy-6-metoxy-1,4-benzoquinol methylase